jgi:predicted aldo/keto reductase-like oxidoreductase
MSEFRDAAREVASEVNRRGFLEAGAGTLVAATALGQAGAAIADEKTKAPNPGVLPKRVLGKTGVEVSILTFGTLRNPGLDRMLRLAWANGISYIDTAKSYGSEPGVGRWLKEHPETRKQVFLVTKDKPQTPRDMIAKLDERLQNLQADYIDLIFIHGLGDHNISAEIEWPRSKEFKETAEAIRKSGKAKFVGFSCHHARQAEILENAAEGSFVDVIMVRNNPWLAKEAPMSRALDACYKAGIGLVSMKQVAGHINPEEIARRLPELKEKGLTPYQSLLHGVWSDERFSSACVSMRNTEQLRENCDAARTFRPMTRAEIERLRDACIAAGPTFCADCDGRCSRAAGTDADLCSLTRFLTYHDHHGHRAEARRLYAELPASARDWTGADLEAARDACPNKLDFAQLLKRVDEKLG